MSDGPDPYRLLFVCSGNICRSPMAEVLAAAYAARRGREMEMQSAGTLGIEDAPADPNVVAVCGEIGLDLTRHRSQGVSKDLVEWADYVLVMQFHHATTLRERFPEIGDKLLMLGALGGTLEIEDPLGGFKTRFRRSRDQIRGCVEVFIDRLPPRMA
ncbi:MAG: low molecular weight phosphotyrosine protein phosphatase [Deltaproteobacteria bacterium]|nr:low molecular weight phosphotyrosine protein phosphatase [Deltaproteobacteria bacterium]